MTRVVIACVLCLATRSAAQPAPDPVAKSGITERVGAALPLSTAFTEATRGPTALGHYFDGKRPVLLVLAYARCTMLCSLVLRGVANVANQIERDYQLVLISLDTRETIDEARRKQATLLATLGPSAAPSRWPYLLGSRMNIDAIAGALGFRYAWDERTQQYAHPAVIFALTPDGRVARYLHGVQFDPRVVTAALDDAAAGRIVPAVAQDVLRCFRFDPASRRVGANVQLFLRIGAASIFAMLCAGVTFLVLWERRLRRRS